MSILVRLYPRAWRERYGDELAAILEDRPPGPFEVADLALGALDAHLHLRGLGHRSDHRKGIPMSLRLAGWAAVVAGASWIVVFAIAAASYINSANYTPIWIVMSIAGLALLIALAGLSVFQFRNHPRLIWIACVVPVIGIGMLLVSMVTVLPMGGWDASEGSPAGAVVFGGLSLMLIGSLVFAAVTVSTAGLSHVAAVAILVGVGPTLAGLFGLIAAVWILVGGTFFGLGWVGLGIDAVRRDRRPVSTGPAAA